MVDSGEQVAIKYEAEGIEVVIMGEVFGQLALVHAHEFSITSQRWYRCPSDEWDIIHIQSYRLIETVECPREQALMVIDALKDFDFDDYWLLIQLGGKSPAFVEAVKRVLAEFRI